MEHIPNYVPEDFYLGYYINDLHQDGKIQFFSQIEADSKMYKVSQLLEDRGYPKSLDGLRNKAYTLWEVLSPDELVFIYRHDWTYQFWYVNEKSFINSMQNFRFGNERIIKLVSLKEMINSNS